MSTRVEPEEAQAIRDAVQPPAGRAGPEVAPRDFGQPMRLSAEARGKAERDVRAALANCEKALERELRARHALELLELSEVNAEGLFQDLDPPFAILCFEVDGQPGWVRWDLVGALAVVETALGSLELSSEPRELTLVERHLCERILGKVAHEIGLALGVETGPFRTVTKPQAIGTWRDGGKGADAQRLRLHLELDGPGGPSACDVYMPGLLSDAGRDAARAPQEFPEHLADVSVTVCAHLGAQEIAFGDLLELEEGDIVPLSTPVGSELRVLAEDVEFARAVMGCHDGRVAIKITRVGDTDDEKETQP